MVRVVDGGGVAGGKRPNEVAAATHNAGPRPGDERAVAIRISSMLKIASFLSACSFSGPLLVFYSLTRKAGRKRINAPGARRVIIGRSGLENSRRG